MPQGNFFLPPYSWTGSMFEDARIYDRDFITVMTSGEDNMDIYSSVPTAVGKMMFSSCSEDDWKYKPVKQWTNLDIMTWIGVVAGDEKLDLEEIDLSCFCMDGVALWNMTKREFCDLDRVVGPVLFNALDKLKDGENRLGYDDENKHGYDDMDDTKLFNLPPFTDIKREESTLCYTNLSSAVPDIVHHTSDNDSDTDRSVKEPLEEKPKRRPGRPPGGRGKKKPDKKCGRLWEFIRDLLLNKQYCPSLICWENYDEGVFRFVRSDKVAELWGSIKDNPKMTYEKLSRAMRYYYKSKVLQPVLGRRLVYKFGPTARGWHTPDPNFRLSSN